MTRKKKIHGAKQKLTGTSFPGNPLPQTKPSSSKSSAKTSSPKGSFLPKPSSASSSTKQLHEMPSPTVVSSFASAALEGSSPNSKKAIDTLLQEPKRVRPRNERQYHRFYEPLVLLFTLGSTRGAPIPDDGADTTTLSSRDARRKFLTALAYACDYEKGGDTVTAIGLEQVPEANIFWVASNKDPIHKIVPFLRKLLSKLAGNAGDEEALEEEISRTCVEFATPRIKKYQSLICQMMSKARSGLTSVETMDLTIWLESFTSAKPTPFSLCELAYKDRKSRFMQQLERLATEPEYKTTKDSIRHVLAMLRHYIGRLGHHMRLAKILVKGASRTPCLLQSWKVEPIPTPPRNSSPLPMDDMTTLNGIIVRMLPKDSPELEYYKEALEHMDNSFQLSTRLLENLKNPNFSPRVHCEVQVLEHFHKNKLQFLELDRYIACSKDACYCCKLYFRYHPGNFVEPNCHHKIYLNWKPPEVDGNDKSHTQRDILNKMINDIRREALDQISQRRAAQRWHPDSRTGITMSVLIENHDSLHDVSAEQASSNILPALSSPHDEPSSMQPNMALVDSDNDSGGGVPLPGSFFTGIGDAETEFGMGG